MTEDQAKQEKKEEKNESKNENKDPYAGLAEQLDVGYSGLSASQNAAVVALLGGGTISEAALIVGVHRNTIHRWMKENPVFRKGLTDAQQEFRQAAISRLHSLGDEAAGCVEAAIRRGDAHVAMRLLKEIGYLGGASTERMAYEPPRPKKPKKSKQDWHRKWQMPNLPRFAGASAIASSIGFFLFGLLIAGALNLRAGEPETSVSGSLGTPAPAVQPGSVRKSQISKDKCQTKSQISKDKCQTKSQISKDKSQTKSQISKDKSQTKSQISKDKSQTKSKFQNPKSKIKRAASGNLPVFAGMRSHEVQHPATFRIGMPPTMPPDDG